MSNLWDILWYGLNNLQWSTIWHWGWFLFLFDIPRFVIADGVILYISQYQRRKNKAKWKRAHRDLLIENPKVSVLVPGHNEGKHYYKLTQSIKLQSYKNIELIVVDDGSTDDSKIIGRSLEKKGDIDQFISAKDRGGKASAANMALEFASGKYIVHIDADSSLDADAIEKILIPFYVHKNIGAVGGNLVVRNTDQSLTTSLQFLEYFKSISTSRIVLSWLGIYKIVSGAFGAFPKKVLDEIGGWDVGPGLDGDITVRIRKKSHSVIFEKEAICYTHVPHRWKALVKQRIRWSRSLIRFRIRKHADVWIPNKNFSWYNFFSFFDSVVFALLLDITWVYYMFKIIIVDPQFLIFWFPFKYLIYLTLSLTRFIYAIAWHKNRKELYKKLIYVPLYTLYIGYFMRIVRTIAYIDEFLFYDSYKDPWNPIKTSQQAKKFNM